MKNCFVRICHSRRENLGGSPGYSRSHTPNVLVIRLMIPALGQLGAMGYTSHGVDDDTTRFSPCATQSTIGAKSTDTCMFRTNGGPSLRLVSSELLEPRSDDSSKMCPACDGGGDAMPYYRSPQTALLAALGAVENLSAAQTVSVFHHQPDGRAPAFLMEFEGGDPEWQLDRSWCQAGVTPFGGPASCAVALRPCAWRPTWHVSRQNTFGRSVPHLRQIPHRNLPGYQEQD